METRSYLVSFILCVFSITLQTTRRVRDRVMTVTDVVAIIGVGSVIITQSHVGMHNTSIIYSQNHRAVVIWYTWLPSEKYPAKIIDMLDMLGGTIHEAVFWYSSPPSPTHNNKSYVLMRSAGST